MPLRFRAPWTRPFRFRWLPMWSLWFSWVMAQPLVAQTWERVLSAPAPGASAIGGGTGNTIYAGLSSGHVYRSDDNGRSWLAVTNGLVDTAGRLLVPKAFVVAPNGRVLRGGDNASWANKVGSPLFRTDNQGTLWTEVPLPFNSPTRNPGGIGISDLVVHQGALYFSDLLSEGIWKSTDNGLSWTTVGSQLPTAPFIGFSKTYYAIASAGDALLTVEPIRGVFRSTDAGATWAQAVNGIPGVPDSPLVGGRSWNGWDAVGAADGTAFAVVSQRLYRSRDAGATWSEVGEGLFSSRKVELLGDRVFVSSNDGNPRFFEGTALGDSWTELPTIAGNIGNASILSQSFAAHNGALYYAGSAGVHRLDLATSARTQLLPLVTTSPAGPFGVNVGASLRIETTARGTAPFTYVWRLNNVALPGQTAQALNFTATSTNQTGTLSVVISNGAGSVTNLLGLLTVAPTAPGTIDYSFKPVLNGTVGTESVTAIAFGPEGSVFLGGNLFSQPDAFTGVRKTFPNGVVDPSFISGAVIGTGSGPGPSVGTPRMLLPLGDGSLLVGATGTSDNERYYRRLLSTGALDPSWPWPVEIAGGPRKIVRLADGRLLIAGGSAGGLQRLNADGTFDPTFHGPASIGRFQFNYVSDFAVLPDGKILIVGRFNDVDGITRASLARLLPSGALDRSWIPAQPPLNTDINALAVLPGGKILIGGSFPTVGNQPHRNLARLNADGTLDASLGDLIPNTNPAGVINTFALQPDGRVWVGGAFTGVASRNYLFRLNPAGTVDTTFPDIGLSKPILALQFTADGRLWIGSTGTQIGGFPAGQLTRIFTDTDGPTLGFAGFDQTHDVGASITLRGTVVGPYTGLQWRFQGAPILGATELTWPLKNLTVANSGNYDLVVTSANGSFTSAPVTVRVRGPVVLDQPPTPQVAVVSNSATFTVNAFGRLPLSYQWYREGALLANATNRTLLLTNLQYSSAADFSVRVMGADNSSATSEPVFLTVIPAPGSPITAFQLRLFPLPFSERALINDLRPLPDGRAVVSGRFAKETNGPAAELARLLPDGSVDFTFNFAPTNSDSLLAMNLQTDGRVVILIRSNLGGAPARLRRLNLDGSLDPTFPETALMAASQIMVAPDNSLVVPHLFGLSRFSSNGVVDSGFATRAKFDSPPGSVSIDPLGRIYVGGIFTTVGGQPQRNIARLLMDGSLDPTFTPTNALSALSVTALAEGVLVLDQSGFNRLDNTGRPDYSYAWNSNLAVWDLDPADGLVGVLPTTFGEGIMLNPDGTGRLPINRMPVPRSFGGYKVLRLAPEGAIWLALGSNSSFDTDPATLLYRLNGDATPLRLITAPRSQVVNSGTKVSFSASATGMSQIRYQWRKNGTDLTGETNTTLIINNAQPVANGTYTITVSNRSGSQTSYPVTLLVLAKPEILSLSSPVELGQRDTLQLSVTAQGVAPLSYEWRRNGAPLPGGQFATYTNRAILLNEAGNYTVVIANSLGAVTSSPVAVTVTLRPGAVIGSFPNLNLSFGVTELNALPNGDFLAGAQAYNRFGERIFGLAFPDGDSTVLRDRVVIDQSAELIFAGPTRRVRAYRFDGTLIPDYAGPNANVRWVRVEAAGTVLQWTESSPALQRLGKNGAVADGFTPAVASGQDALPLSDGKILLLSGNIVLRLNADGSIDSTFNRSTNNFLADARAKRLGADRQGRFFVFGGFESYNGQPRSRIARFQPDGTLDPSFRPPTINSGIEEIAIQLNGRIVVVGSFTQVDGQSRSLVARLNPDGSHDTTFNPGSGLTATGGQTLAYDVAILNAGEIAVAGTFDHADGVLHQGIVLLTGDTPDLYFTREPADTEITSGGSADLQAEAIGTSPVNYQWFKDGQPLLGETNLILHLSQVTAKSDGTYRAVVHLGAVEITSRAARVQVVLPPIITSQPTSVVINQGQNASFSVAASGLRLAFQWRREGVNLPGATNSALVVSNEVKGGRYSVNVANPAGSILSADALIRIRPAVATVTNSVSADRLLGRHSFEGTLHEDSLRYGGAPLGAPTYVDGHTGSAVRITTGKNYVQLGLAPLTVQQYTASFWIRPETTNSLNVFSLPIGNSEHYLFLGGNDTSTFGSRVFYSSRGFNTVVSADDRAYVPNLVGKWTHFALVFRGGIFSAAANCSVYVNGEALPLTNSINALGGSANSIATFGRYGGGVFGANSIFQLDDFQLYNRALDFSEILSLAHPASATPAPVITQQPVGGTASLGEAFAFKVEATGTNLFYEWFHGTNLLAAIDGPTLLVPALSASDAGDYQVVISNSGGSTNSARAALTVTPATDPYVAWSTAAGLATATAGPEADPDADGSNNLAEFYYGTSPTKANEHPAFAVSTTRVGGLEYPAITFSRRQSAGPVRLTTQVASSVRFNDNLGTTVVNVTPLGNGFEQVVIRSDAPMDGYSNQFFRFTVRR